MSGISWSRDVKTDLQELQRKYNLSILISLMEKHEFEVCFQDAQ